MRVSATSSGSVSSDLILEDAFEADLHDIAFARHRTADMQGHEVRVIRLGMSGNLAYEIHGPMADYDYVYRRVIESGKKFGAKRLGNQSHHLFNRTEAGFPNIALHSPLPFYESGDAMKSWFDQNMMAGFGNNNRVLTGSSQDLQERFVTPYDLNWDFLVKFNHDFVGYEALEKTREAASAIRSSKGSETMQAVRTSATKVLALVCRTSHINRARDILSPPYRGGSFGYARHLWSPGSG